MCTCLHRCYFSQTLLQTSEDLMHWRGQVDLTAAQLRLANDAAEQRTAAWEAERAERDAKQEASDVLVEVWNAYEAVEYVVMMISSGLGH